MFTRRFYEYDDSLFMLNYIYTRSIDDVRTTTTILLFTLSAFVGVNEVRVLLLIFAEMIKEIGRGLFFFTLVFRVVTKRGKRREQNKFPPVSFV